jgi:sec-independent protein translocase protein TatB
MIDFGFDKLALIGAVALIVIGPEKLPRVARTVGHLLGKAQRYVADVKAEVNRSIELDELKKMKTQFEDAARDVEKHRQPKCSRPAPVSSPTGETSPPGSTEWAAVRRARRPASDAAVQAPEEELAPEARRHAAVVQAAPRRAHARRSRARRAWRASARRATRPGSDAGAPHDAPRRPGCARGPR